MIHLYQNRIANLASTILITLLFLSGFTTYAQVTRYVKQGGTGNGSSWADASGDLQLMINSSTSGDQVWVARGTYKPNRKFEIASISGNHQDNTFTLKRGVNVYGSFAGTETTVNERKVDDNPTILSGDFSGNDIKLNGNQLATTYSEKSDNAYHVVVAYNYIGVFDGFQIVNGNAVGTGSIEYQINRRYGGGIYIANSGGIFRNILIMGSRATNQGGAIYMSNSSTSLINLNIIWCYAGEGGGIYAYECSSAIQNSIITGCYAGSNSFGGGAITVDRNYPALVNCVIYDNHARTSGAAFCIKAYSRLHVRNCIVRDNDFWMTMLTGTNTGITINNSNVQPNGTAGSTGSNNIDADPKFVNPSRFDFRLMPDSPSVNTGNNQYVETTTDKAGNPRMNGTVDMGAYEYHAVPIRYVKQVASGTGDGSSWANASDDLQLMINNAMPGEQVWVAKGTYKPIRTPNEISSVTPGNRSNTFLLKSGVSIYGSFAGNETNINGRDFTGNATVLSGDFNDDDVVVTADKLSNASLAKNGENALHVVSVVVQDNIVFDGFTIKGGNADMTQTQVFLTFGIEGPLGGGMYIDSSANSTFKNIIFESCHGYSSGGAFYISYSDATVSNISINNSSSTYGAISNYYCTPVYNNILISNCYGIAGSAITGINTTSQPVQFTNLTVAFNQASDTGGTIKTHGSTVFDIRNALFFGNTGSKFISTENTSTVKFTNSLVQGSGGSQAWDTEFGINGDNNIDADPLFTNTANREFTLQAGSPAINAGNNTFVTGITEDIAGNNRIYGDTVDMGAYEYNNNDMPIRYVKQDGTGDGSSWANASGDLQAMINRSDVGEEVWVAKGTYKPNRKPGRNTITLNDRDNAFLLKSGVKVYGSFAGNEDMIDQRSIAANPTILSGDFAGNDVDVQVTSLNNSAVALNGENAHHVVAAIDLSDDTVFDGFQISGGNANGTGSYTVPGLSMSRLVGGGMNLRDSFAKISNIAIRDCNANNGAAIYIINSGSVVTEFVNIAIDKCHSDNAAAGVYLSGSHVFNNLLVLNCYSGLATAVHASSGESITIVNATMSANSGNQDLLSLNSSTVLHLRNSIISGNTMPYNFGGGNATFNVGYSLLEGGITKTPSPTVNDLGNNINAAATFVDPSTGNFMLQTGSLGINTGNNSYVTETGDIAGNTRIQGGTVDMGAYEYSGESCAKPAAPEAVNQEYCTNATVADLVAQGNNLKWYTSAEAETPLAATDPLTIANYYVSQTNGTCESERTAVPVDLSVCGNVTVLRPASCGASLPAFTSYVYAKSVVGATQYRFRVTNGVNVQTVDKPKPSLKFNELATYAYATQYDVDVAVYKDGKWEPYGPSCTVTTPALPVPQVKGTQCGTTQAFTAYVYTAKLPLASNYRFRVTNGAQEQVIERANARFKLNELLSYTYGQDYSIAVSAFISGQWTAYGPSCTVSSPAIPLTQLKAEQCGATMSAFTAYVYGIKVPLATNYRFRISTPSGTQVIESAAASFRVDAIQGYDYGQTYPVEVASYINGQWTGYGTVCNISTPALPVAMMDASSCGITVNEGTRLLARIVPFATSYSFRISDGTTTETITKTVRDIRLGETSLYGLDKTFTIEVSVTLSTGSTLPYGPACTVAAKATPVTQLISSQCGIMITSFDSTLMAGALSGVDGYRFRLTDVYGNEEIITRENNYFRFSMMESPQYYMNYTIDVAVLRGEEWGQYGQACTVTATQGGANRESYAAGHVALDITLTAYPNPYTDAFTLDMATPSGEKVTVRAYDMNGRLVEDLTASPEELSSQKLGSGYAAGVYSVIVSQGSYQKTFKVVKK